MGVNKVEFGGQVLIDLTKDTVTPETLTKGVTTHNAAGEPITGTKADPVFQSKTVSPATSQQTVAPDAGYDGLSEVTVNAMPTASQATPSISVNSSGLITATATQSAGYVSSGTKSATRQLTTQASKTVTPTTSQQTAVSSGRYTIGAVYVKGDANLIPENIVSGTSIFGVEGTAETGGFPNGTKWTKSNCTAKASFLCFANDIWCVATQTGLYYSTDGKTWIQSTITEYTTDVCYGNGLWVACGYTSHRIYTSVDGKTWETGQQFAKYPRRVFYGAGVWVVLIHETGVYRSTDAQSWTKTSTFTTCLMYCAERGVWLGASGSALYSSEDGSTWTSLSSPDASGKTIDNMFYEGGVFFITLSTYPQQYIAYYSTDFETWTSMGESTYFTSLIFAKGKWFASSNATTWGNGKGLKCTEDCVNWIDVTLPSTVSTMGPLCSGNGIIVVRADARGYWSADGVNWNTMENKPFTAMYTQNDKIKCENGIWVCSSQGGLFYSVVWEPS